MHRRAFLHQRRIEREDHQRREEPDVAAVERDRVQHVDVAAAQDDDHAGERNQDADDLPQGQAVAEHREGPQRDHQRGGGLGQQRVDRLRILQAPIGHRVVGRGAGDREHCQERQVAADHRPVAFQIRPGERQDDEERDPPAQKRQRDRRKMSGDIAPEHDVERPGHVGDADEQIGLLIKPAAEPAQHARHRQSPENARSMRRGRGRHRGGRRNLLHARPIAEPERASHGRIAAIPAAPSSAAAQCREFSRLWRRAAPTFEKTAEIERLTHKPPKAACSCLL